MLKLRMVMVSASVALLAGCGPVAGGASGDAAPTPVVNDSPTVALAVVPPPVTDSPTPSPAVAAAGTATTTAVPAPAKTTKTTTAPAVHCGADYYVNSSGNCVHRPATAATAPAGATAECQDGTFSFSQHRQGTCSHHGGVKRWL